MFFHKKSTSSIFTICLGELLNSPEKSQIMPTLALTVGLANRENGKIPSFSTPTSTRARFSVTWETTPLRELDVRGATDTLDGFTLATKLENKLSKFGGRDKKHQKTFKSHFECLLCLRSSHRRWDGSCVRECRAAKSGPMNDKTVKNMDTFHSRSAKNEAPSYTAAMCRWLGYVPRLLIHLPVTSSSPVSTFGWRPYRLLIRTSRKPSAARLGGLCESPKNRSMQSNLPVARGCFYGLMQLPPGQRQGYPP